MPTPTLRQADLSLPGLLASAHGAVRRGGLTAAIDGYASARIAHNTYVEVEARDNGSALVKVILHKTCIAAYHQLLATDETPDLWVLTVNTGGWDTVTTRDRLNRVLRPLGLSVYRDRGVTVLDGVSVDGRLATRALYKHDGHRLPVTTALADGARVVPPALPADNLQRLLDQGVRTTIIPGWFPE